MIQAIPTYYPERVEADFYPSLKNPAVALCTEAWQKIHAATAKQTLNLYTAERCASKAYRMCLPPLSGYQNICDFIACVGYGMLIGAIKPETGTKLLYAAQVALGAVPREAKTQTRTGPHPAPPPLSPQSHKKKGIRPKKPVSTPPSKGLTTLPIGENPAQP